MVWPRAEPMLVLVAWTLKEREAQPNHRESRRQGGAVASTGCGLLVRDLQGGLGLMAEHDTCPALCSSDPMGFTFRGWPAVSQGGGTGASLHLLWLLVSPGELQGYRFL